ncbi:hypothetical protein EUZ85_20100 [Hahella sp. KA22]|uniref:hypothetical protein n=1 Tax=Hahella sp. KA22 TaxID=1628392 RepID=UPI000FDDFCF4|nr:hypothetical protein [Hahella sp. KA22]AZZ92904.1 hypothetical protein ENC22_17520 [Hahella sp. KA22]QAY56278.1 hypothetical protein EUZ85_20100 [Hahella sp. KA22]
MVIVVPVIFNLKDQPLTWANDVNTELARYAPDYIEKYGKVGSQMWWSAYSNNEIPKTSITGIITFIGLRKDDCEELWDIVEISSPDRQVEYERIAYWLNEAVTLNAEVRMEQFSIYIPHKYGPMTSTFDCAVEVNDRGIDQRI